MNLNGRLYTDLKNTDLNSVPDSDRKILEFCKGWLNHQPSFLINTSGSTGKPKLISISREQMAASARMTGRALGLKENDHAFICLNTDYIAGMMMLVRGMELKLKMTVVPPSSNPFINLPSNTRIDFVALVPLQLSAILKDPLQSLPLLNQMKAVIIGGAAVNSELESSIRSIKAPVYLTYGMTETVSHIALRPLNGTNASDLFTCLEGVEIKSDERQCLQIKASVTNNEWITTNDLVELTGSIEFKLLGRIDNVINSGGIKIQIEALEVKIEKLFFSQGIKDRFFISSKPHPDLGESILLVVEGIDKDKVLEQKITSILKQNLQRFEIPKNIIFTPEFTMTETSKIDRKGTMRKINLD